MPKDNLRRPRGKRVVHKSASGSAPHNGRDKANVNGEESRSLPRHGRDKPNVNGEESRILSRPGRDKANVNGEESRSLSRPGQKRPPPRRSPRTFTFSGSAGTGTESPARKKAFSVEVASEMFGSKVGVTPPRLEGDTSASQVSQSATPSLSQQLTPISRAIRRPRMAEVTSTVGHTPPPQVLFNRDHKANLAAKVRAYNAKYLQKDQHGFPRLPQATPPRVREEEPPSSAASTRKSIDSSAESNVSGDVDFLRVRHLPASSALLMVEATDLSQPADDKRRRAGEENSTEMVKVKKDIASWLQAPQGQETSIIGEVLLGMDEPPAMGSKSPSPQRRISAPDSPLLITCNTCCCSQSRLYVESVAGITAWRTSSGHRWSPCSSCCCCQTTNCICSCLGHHGDPDAFRRASEGSNPVASAEVCVDTENVNNWDSTNIDGKNSPSGRCEGTPPDASQVIQEEHHRRRSISEPKGRPNGPGGICGRLPKPSTYYQLNPWLLDDASLWSDAQIRKLCGMVGVQHQRFPDRERLDEHIRRLQRTKTTFHITEEDIQHNKSAGLIDGGVGFAVLGFNKDSLPLQYRSIYDKLPMGQRLCGIIRDRHNKKERSDESRRIHFSPYNHCHHIEISADERKQKQLRLIEIGQLHHLGVDTLDESTGRELTAEVIMVNPTIELQTDPKWAQARANMYANLRVTGSFASGAVLEPDWMDAWDLDTKTC